MTDANQLAKLKRMLMITDTSKDDLLYDLLDDAQTSIDMQCRPPVNNAETAEQKSIAVSLAVIAYNRMGMEGQTGHGEGGVSVSVTNGVPADLQQRINRFRTAIVG